MPSFGPDRPAPFIEDEAVKFLLPHVVSYSSKGLEAFQLNRKMLGATDLEIYSHAVFSRVSELDNSIASLWLANCFVIELCNSLDPDPELYVYHYENFILRGIGLIDRVFLLVAEVLKLSKAARGTNRRIVSGAGLHVDIQNKMIAIKSVMEPFRKARNSVVHDSAYSNKDLGALMGIRKLRLNVEVGDVSAIARAHFFSGSEEMASVQDNLVKAISALFVVLAPVLKEAVGVVKVPVSKSR